MLPYILKINWYDLSKHSPILFLCQSLYLEMKLLNGNLFLFKENRSHYFYLSKKPTDFSKRSLWSRRELSRVIDASRSSWASSSSHQISRILRPWKTPLIFFFAKRYCTTTPLLKVWFKKDTLEKRIFRIFFFLWHFFQKFQEQLVIWLCSSPGMVPLKSGSTPGAFLEMAWHRPGFHRYSQLS